MSVFLRLLTLFSHLNRTMNTPPSIIFPPAGPPMSPKRDDYLSYNNNNEIHQWLLTTATRNSSSYNSESFGSLASSIHSHDRIEVQWEERIQGRQSVTGVILYCIMCDDPLNDDQGALWKPCMTNLTDKQPTINTVSDFAGSPTSATVTTPEMDMSDGLPGIPSKGPMSMMVCTIVLTLDTTLFSGLNARPLIPSQLFLAVNKPRGSVPFSSAHYTAYIYNSTYPMGTPSKEIALASSAPSSEAILPYGGLSYAATRGSGSCSTGNEWKCKPIGDRVGIVRKFTSTLQCTEPHVSMD
ncbi:hypothetical protein J1614_000538 [Plenodomus biglobosus]|nr:hypothetical protein J1614_000538 [Plenodomus biglobosus]